MNRPHEVRAKILRHQRLGGDCFRLVLLCPEIARHARPGQFIMLRVSPGKDPFLRRPFGFARLFPPKGGRRPEEKGSIEVWYQVVGSGTFLLSKLREGERMDVLGPLGRGFWREDGQREAILIGGGIGIAPLLAWAEELKGPGRRKRGRGAPEEFGLLVLVGGKGQERILGGREFRRLGIEPQVATEDGSLGLRGMATDLLERELITKSHPGATLYACGPLPMLDRVAQISLQFDLPCQVLIESRMACGVGACLGCAVKVQVGGGEPPPPEEIGVGETDENGRQAGEPSAWPLPPISEQPFRYALSCQEGPVFSAREILWE